MSDEELKALFTKVFKSYKGIVPSQDLNEEQYEVFLNIASPEELEQDILTKQTLDKIMEHFMKDGIRGIIWCEY